MSEKIGNHLGEGTGNTPEGHQRSRRHHSARLHLARNRGGKIPWGRRGKADLAAVCNHGKQKRLEADDFTVGFPCKEDIKEMPSGDLL